MAGQWIKSFLSAPEKLDEADARAGSILHVITLWGVPVLLIFIVLRVVGGNALTDDVNLYAEFMIAMFILGRLVLKSGYVRWAGLTLTLLAWTGFSWVAWNSHEPRGFWVIGYLTITLVSGFLFGSKESLFFLAISFLAIWGFAYADSSAVDPSGNGRDPYASAVNLTLSFSLTWLVLHFFIRTWRKSLVAGDLELRSRRQAVSDLKQQAAYLNALHETTLNIIDRLELRPLLESILTRACDLMGTRNGFIELLVPDGSALRMELGLGIPASYEGRLTQKNEGFTGKVWATGKTQFVTGYSHWEHRDPKLVGRIHAIIGLPLRSGGDVIGVLALLCVDESRPFYPEHISLLEQFASLASLAIQNARLYEEAQKELAERRLAQTALRENEEKFRKIFQSSPAAICITTLEDGCLLDANQAFWDLTGMDREDALGKTSVALNLWESLEARASFVNELKRKGSLYDPEDSLQHRDGSLKYISTFSELIHVGGEAQVLSMFLDMSRQRQTISALRMNEARTRALLEATPDMILELAADGLIADMVPPKGLETVMPRERFIGVRIQDLLSETSALQTLFAVERSLATGHMSVFEFEESMGEMRLSMEARMVPASLDKALMIVRDITQRKWVEKEREKLINELEQKNEEAETLRESAATVALSLDVDETVSRILDQLQRVIPYDSASIQLLAGNELEVIGGRGFPDGKDAKGIRFVLDENDPAYPIIRDGLPYILYPDIQSVSNRFKGFVHDHILSWMAIPLYSRGRLIGMFTLDGFVVNKFTKSHAHFASIFANQVAVTLENSRLYVELQAELKKQVALRGAIGAISSSLRLREVLEEICRQMASAIDATSVYIADYDSARSSFTVVAEHLSRNANELEKVSDMGKTYEKKDGALILDETGEAGFEIQHAGDPDLTEWAKENLRLYGGQSILYIPLQIQGRIVGHAELWDSRGRRDFTSEEISFCQAISQQAAVAIENANLFEESQKDLALRQSLISELESKNAELERFAYTVSHDLKSPLFTIRGFLGYLEEDALAGNKERMRSDIQRITDATEKMQQLLNELLELSRVGRLRNEMEFIPFDELAHEAVALVQGRIMQHGIAVHVDADMPVVYGERPRLLEVVQNLVDNAAKFMGEQPEPRIEIGWNGTDDGNPIFHVRDNGMGISRQHHERIFGLFNKLDVKAEGSGVGLALVKRIIEVHGGRIWVESKLGRGSTFFFTLAGGRSNHGSTETGPKP